jgi:hypothetical protein
MNVRFRVEPPGHEPFFYGPAGDAFVVGRSASADLPIDDTRMSRIHARFSLSAGDWWVEDQGSSNGTLVNGQSCAVRRRLKMGDVVAVGNTHIALLPGQTGGTVRGLEALVKVILVVTDYVMRFAPVAVFAAVTATIAERGISILATYGYFMGSFYAGLAILWALLIGACFLIVGARTKLLVRYIRQRPRQLERRPQIRLLNRARLHPQRQRIRVRRDCHC